ncbi:hypothetical protein BHM03_00055466 [Ensete ventricosum]|nr:hypothetical protein BHM03_00055466 [Ensete ventricosum]
MTNPLRERHHEDKQAGKNMLRTKVGMAKFELQLDVIQLMEAKLGSEDLSTGQEDAEAGVTREWVGESELRRERTKIEDSGGPTMCWQRPHMERLCKVTDSRAMGLAAPWYCRGGTSVESSILCSHGGRALVVKGAEEVENAWANSKYQDKAEGQRPRNFIRPVSTGFSSR